MTENLSHWSLSESTQSELSNEYQHDRVEMFLSDALDESSLSIGRVLKSVIGLNK